MFVTSIYQTVQFSSVARLCCLVYHAVAQPTAEKLRGTKVWVPTPGRKRPAPDQRRGWVLGAGRGHLSRCEGPGYHPTKIFENSRAKSCILVTTCCEISCYLKTTAKKLGDQYIVGPPSLPRSLRLLRLWYHDILIVFAQIQKKTKISHRSRRTRSLTCVHGPKFIKPVQKYHQVGRCFFQLPVVNKSLQQKMHSQKIPEALKFTKFSGNECNRPFALDQSFFYRAFYSEDIHA